MSAITLASAVALASPYAADPVGTKRPYVDFADNRDNPTKIANPYVNRAFGQDPLAAIFGIEDGPAPRVREAATLLGYDPDKIFHQVADASFSGAQRQPDGHLVTSDEALETSPEVWVGVEDADGNVFEGGVLTYHNLTLVRVI